MSIKGRMDKEDVSVIIHVYNGILLNHKKGKIVPFTETWMDLETTKRKLRVTHLHIVPQVLKPP